MASPAKKAKPPRAGRLRGFLFPPHEIGMRRTYLDFSKIIREVRIMTDKLSPPRFWALWLVFFVIAVGYLSSNLPWDRLLS
ncbi:hypothetical protein AN399_27580 [Pseudomonas aeruginosa]|nr:hypothetical protein AN399_27580 [Pseudomonas aeruginosa]